MGAKKFIEEAKSILNREEIDSEKSQMRPTILKRYRKLSSEEMEEIKRLKLRERKIIQAIEESEGKTKEFRKRELTATRDRLKSILSDDAER